MQGIAAHPSVYGYYMPGHAGAASQNDYVDSDGVTPLGTPSQVTQGAVQAKYNETSRYASKVLSWLSQIQQARGH